MSDPSHDPGATDGIPRAGDVLAGKYRVERVLGAGGMGVVVAALHLQLGERVALKFLLATMTSPETLARFSREARAAARIKSEHVARVTDVGTLDSGAPYMVMEYLEGGDLGSVLAAKGALPIRDAVEYLVQACEAVAEAHTLGIVHRDLKPANLFLAQRAGRSPIVKVLDFGISKVRQREPSLPPEDPSLGMTRTRAWLGSPLYMSPEQMRSARDVDARADVWALGVILFELLSGAVPFDGQTFPELCAQILHGEPTLLEQVRPDAPAALGAVISRCLEKMPEKRYQNIGELVLGLAPFAPRRALPVAERAVALLEAAGLMSAAAPRTPLDGTLPEPVESPFARDSGAAFHRTSAMPSAPPAALAEVAPPSVEPAVSLTPAPGGGARALAFAAGLLAILAGFAFYYFRVMRHPAADPTTEAATSVAPAAASSEAASAAPSSEVSSEAASASVAASATATASATAPVAAADAGAPVVDAGVARGSAPDPRRSAAVGPGKVPVAPPAPTAHPAVPSTAGADVPPAPPPGSELSTTNCREQLPDGTFRSIPCPK